MELMDSPVCVITYRHPARVALRLGNHWYKGTHAKLDADAWLAVWEFMMTSALKTCRGKVTVVARSLDPTVHAASLFTCVYGHSVELCFPSVPITPPQPTVLVQSVLAKPESLQVFYDTVIPALQAVGIKDIVRPTQQVLQEHFIKYYRCSMNVACCSTPTLNLLLLCYSFRPLFCVCSWVVAACVMHPGHMPSWCLSWPDEWYFTRHVAHAQAHA